jgi:hypothetical protein
VSVVTLYNPLCSKCRKPMGEMTQDEFEALILLDGSVGKCFDCDTFEAGLYPELFWEITTGSIVVLGGERFVYDCGFWKREKSIQSRAHVSARAPGLSSSTKVNRSQHNRMVLRDGLEIEICPNCKGLGYVEQFDVKYFCEGCDGLGSIVTAVFLPNWLLGLGCENA